MIEAVNLSYTYPGGERAALQKVSVCFPREAVSAIIGQSGSGKTTLMMCLGRFLQPSTGQALYDGTDICTMPEHAFRRTLGIVFQKLYLFPHLTVLRNMTLAMRHVLNRDGRQARREARAMLERLGIDEIADRYPSQISGGQAQRVAIARGLLLKPDYMLLDEPTSALDARTTEDFAEWLKKLKHQTNFIIVTHDVLFAREVADRGVCLTNGEIAAEGPVDEILAQLSAPAAE